MAKLTLYTNEGSRELELTELITIGRHDGCTVTLTDGMLSKHHVKIFPREGRWYAEDLGSTNGTFVNGARIHSVELGEGDEIVIGRVRGTFSLAPGQGQQQPGRQTPEGVKILSSAMSSITRAKLGGEQQTGDFLPVEQLPDVEQLKRDYEKLRIANVLNKAIGIESDVDKLLPRLLDETFKLIPADRGCILLTDESGELKPRAVKRSPRAGDEEIVMSSTILNDVTQNLSAVLTNDAMMDDRYSGSQSIIATAMRATMCVPMIHKGKLLGVLHADSMSASSAFSEKDLQILSGVAAQAAQAIDNALQAKELERNALARRDFERLLPPQIVEQVVSGEVRLERGGRETTTTILFSDVRGFTAWSERHEASYIVEILNDYFERMVESIHRHNGTLDKFMGDGIMALFGAPISHGNDALNAVNCALEMMQSLQSFNAMLAERSGERIQIGIGVNTGPVVVGYMGSSKSMEYTAIGDHVNLSSRLCGVAAPGQVLISDTTRRWVADHFHLDQLEPVSVKGKREPVPCFQVVGPAQAARSEAARDTGVHDVPPPPSDPPAV